MNKSAVTWFLAAVLAVATSVLGHRPAATAPNGAPVAIAQASADTADASDPDNRGAWGLLWRFASGRPNVAEGRPAPGRQTSAPVNDMNARRAILRDRLAAFDTDFVIATAADPIESHAQEDFDRSLQAIQAALGAAGYSLSRFELPWQNSAHQQTQSAQERALPDGTYRPGAMLFFKDGASSRKPRLLMVFVIGETPTGGIHKAAFLTALRQANEICRVANCQRRAGGGAIRILGPTFSGSLQSMQTALDDYLKPNRDTVMMISGSATAPELRSLSERETFETTVHNDGETLGAVYRYLHNHCHAQAREFGILYEEGTGYGASASELLQDYLFQKFLHQRYQSLATIPFPFGISELSAQSSSGRAENTAPDLSAGGDRIVPILTPENAGHDMIPAFSSLKQADADRALASALATIGELNLKYVGILATNVRDTIFLAQQIRTHIPNIVVFVLDNDSLYLNGEVVHDLRGMLIASTYPLFPASGIFGHGPEVGFIFSSQQQEGTYNAMLALLRDDAAMLDYRAPDFGGPGFKPPVWLTVVGSSQIWPVGAIDTPGERLHLASAPAPPVHGRNLNDGLMPRILKLLLLFAGALSICAAAIRLMAISGYPLPKSAGALRETIAPFARAQNYYAFALLLIAAILFALSSLTIILPVLALPDYFHFSWWVGPWIFVVSAFLLAAIVAQGYRVLNQFDSRREADEHFAASTATVLPIMWLVLLVWFGWAEARTHEGGVLWTGAAAALRYANIDSGISTFRPLFLIGMAALSVAYGALRRLQLGEQLFANRGAGVPRFLNFDSPSFRSLRSYEDRLSSLISTVSLGGRSGRYHTAALFVLAAIIVWWLFRPLGNRHFGWPFVYSFEAPQFNWLFIIAFVAVYLEIAHSAMRCALTWRQFKGVLHRLSQSPLVEDFARVGEEASADKNPAPRLQLSMPEATFTSLYFSVQAADQIAQCAAITPPVRNEARALKTSFDAAVEYGAQGAAALIQDMARLSAQICAGLEPFSPMRLRAEPESAADQAIARCRYYLATRVVHYCWIMLVEFRNWMIFTGAGLFLMLMAVSSYPFINSDSLLRFSWVALLAGIFLAVTLLVQINRDKVLSLLSGGTPGKIDWNWDFMSRLLIYGLLPVLALLGVQFPATLSGISHFVQTALGGTAGLK